MKIDIPKPLKEIAQTLDQNGFESYLVGGGVRDQLLGRAARDYDLATNGSPTEVMKLFKRVIPTGLQHGTVTIIHKGESYEVTTYRIDGKYTDGRHPDKVCFTRSIEEDLKRRDFTINSIAYNIIKNKIYDPNNGIPDLKNKIIRAIGVPKERFDEDALRMVRCCRFASQLEFKVEQGTFIAITEAKEKIPLLAKERIYDELRKIMTVKTPSLSFRLMDQSGILEILLPELAKCVGVEQKGWHQFDVFEHSLLCCDYISPDNIELRFAGLFHDIGKPPSKKWDKNGIPTFFNHEQLSAKMSLNIMKRYKFPNKSIEYITHMIENHMFHYTADWTDAAIRRFLVRVDPLYVKDLFLLRDADHYGFAGKIPIPSELEKEFLQRINSTIEKESALSLKDLAINGKILISEASIVQGRFLGETMNFLFEAVLDDPALNTRDKLIDMAKAFNKEYGKE